MGKLHIDNWVGKAEPDYYTMFVKAWIPLNAWYCEEYNTTNDSEALKKIKTTTNKIRNRIEALLKNSDKISIKFRSDLAYLQHELKQRTIINRGSPVSFEHVKLDEYFPELITHHKDDIIYKITPNKQTGFKVTVVAKDNSKTYMDKTFNPYSIETLKLENQFIVLPDEIRLVVQKLFEDVNPERPFNLVIDKLAPGAIILDEDLKLYFKNDTELIAKSLVQILYELRCLLFHGVLDPTEINQPIYEHAFSVLKTLIKELK
jgi:hypothetical protein